MAVTVHPFNRSTTLDQMRGVSRQILQLPFDAATVQNCFPGNFINNPLTAWLNRGVDQRLPELAGSDSHAPIMVGQPYTRFSASASADLRQAIKQGTTWAK